MSLLIGGSPEYSSKNFREALKRLEEKGLVAERSLTEKGKKEAMWRADIIERTRDVYDLKAGGGYMREIHFVYEPVEPFSYAWNWVGRKGVSVVKFDPKRKEYYFEVLEKKFWFSNEKTLKAEELTFNMPSSQIVKAWSKGTLISLGNSELWDLCHKYFMFFLDLKEPAFYDMLCLATFQSWLLVDESILNSCFFIVVKGAYGGGKSVTCEALIFLCSHGKVASPSIAYLGRSIERLRICVFIDEFDIIIEKDPELGRLARMCQRRGQSYDRSTKSGVPQSFQVFCPWVMSVHGEVEDALATRSIPITTQETGDHNIPVANPEKTKMGKEIYDQLWIWYLDSIDYISYTVEAQRNLDFSMSSLFFSLIVEQNGNGSYVTVEGNPKENVEAVAQKRRVAPGVSTYITTNNSSYNIESTRDLRATKEKLGNLRIKVAKAILSSCSEKQVNMIKSAAGRNVELMNNCFKIANILKVDCDNSIAKAFEIKKEVEEEEREVGLTGYLRDFLAQIYKDRRENQNYWTSREEFMISNKECTDAFTKFLHRREQPAVNPGDFKRALRELGFVRPTSRRKMKILTWREIEDGIEKKIEGGTEKKRTRLANIYTYKVLRRLELTVKIPDFRVEQKKMDDVDILDGKKKPPVLKHLALEDFEEYMEKEGNLGAAIIKKTLNIDDKTLNYLVESSTVVSWDSPLRQSLNWKSRFPGDEK